MTYKELTQKALNMSMDELQDEIDSLKAQVDMLEQVKKIRMRDGEFTTKQAQQKMARDKHKKKVQSEKQ